MIDQILSKAIQFEHKTGKKPEYVYLGEMEWMDLKLECLSMTIPGQPIHDHTKVNDMIVVEVKVDSHLRVS